MRIDEVELQIEMTCNMNINTCGTMYMMIRDLFFLSHQDRRNDGELIQPVVYALCNGIHIML